MKSSLILVAAMLTLSACAEREDPDNVAAAQSDRDTALRASEAAARTAADTQERDEIAESSSWSVQGEESERAVAFGPPEGDALFTAQCDATKREIVFSRAVLVGGGQIDMKVGTGAQIKVFQADARSDPSPAVTGRLASTDPVVQAIVASSEPMSVQVGDGDVLMIPSDGLFKQLVEKCI